MDPRPFPNQAGSSTEKDPLSIGQEVSSILALLGQNTVFTHGKEVEDELEANKQADSILRDGRKAWVIADNISESSPELYHETKSALNYETNFSR